MFKHLILMLAISVLTAAQAKINGYVLFNIIVSGFILTV